MKKVTVCTDPSWDLRRQFCFAVVERWLADRLTEGLLYRNVDSVPVSHIGI
jgi:hypothetical protein